MSATPRPMWKLAVAGAVLLAGGAACGSGGGGLPAVSGPAAARLELNATEMRYTPSRIAVAGGDVPVVLHNTGVVVHDLRIEGIPALGVEALPGRTATASWRLTRGRYRIYCSIPGHRQAGMEGILEVR